jgi:hypothetical protein
MASERKHLLITIAAVAAAVLFVSVAHAGSAVGDDTPVMVAAKPAAGSASPPLDSTGASVPGRRDNAEYQARLARWRALPPEEQKRLKERYEAWQKLPEDRKTAIREHMNAWRQMPPDAKKKVMDRMREYHQLPPDRNERMRRHWEAWSRMSPERKALARRVAGILRELPKEEIQRLKAMPLDERRAALKDLLAAKGVEIMPMPPAVGRGGDGERGPGRNRMELRPDGRQRSGDMRDDRWPRLQSSDGNGDFPHGNPGRRYPRRESGERSEAPNTEESTQ